MRNKFPARKCYKDGYTFDSLMEGRRWEELKLLEKAGAISGLAVHPKFLLQPAFSTNNGVKVRAITYTGDFAYIENGLQVVEDVKGGKATQTKEFVLRSKMLQYRYRDIVFRIVDMSGGYAGRDYGC